MRSQGKFTDKELIVIARLAEGHTHPRIAEEVKVSLRTVERWRQKPEIVAEVEKARAKTLESIATRCQEQITRMVPLALNVVSSILKDSEARPSDKLRAADIVGKWAGLSQVAIASTNQKPPETQLQDYLAYLSSKNGGTNGTSTSQH